MLSFTTYWVPTTRWVASSYISMTLLYGVLSLWAKQNTLIVK